MIISITTLKQTGAEMSAEEKNLKCEDIVAVDSSTAVNVMQIKSSGIFC